MAKTSLPAELEEAFKVFVDELLASLEFGNFTYGKDSYLRVDCLSRAEELIEKHRQDEADRRATIGAPVGAVGYLFLHMHKCGML